MHSRNWNLHLNYDEDWKFQVAQRKVCYSFYMQRLHVLKFRNILGRMKCREIVFSIFHPIFSGCFEHFYMFLMKEGYENEVKSRLNPENLPSYTTCISKLPVTHSLTFVFKYEKREHILAFYRVNLLWYIVLMSQVLMQVYVEMIWKGRGIGNGKYC